MKCIGGQCTRFCGQFLYRLETLGFKVRKEVVYRKTLVHRSLLCFYKNRFLTAVEKLSHERRRNGACAYGVFDDAAECRWFLETCMTEPWLEPLRRHEQVPNADRMLQCHVLRLVQGTLKVSHLVAAETAAGDPEGESA